MASEATTEILGRLEAEFDGFPPQLQRAARFVIDNPREVGVQSMRGLAGKAEVHPNTLVRLAQAVGFEGWEALRERFRDFVVGGGMGGFRDRAEWLKRLSERGGSAAVTAEMAQATADNLDAMWRGQSPEALERVADALLGARTVYVAGMGSAYSLAHQFWYVARMAFDNVTPIPRHGSQPIDDLAHLTAEDAVVALTFQPYRSETMAAVAHAKAVGATLIGITDSRTAPLARLADETLVSPTSTPQFFESHAAVTALLDGLLAVMVARAGGEVAERIETFHQRRLGAGLYHEPDALAKLG